MDLVLWIRQLPDPDEKGIRLESGAVPAAVSLKTNLSETPATVRLLTEWEGIRKRGEPEDLPKSANKLTKASGIKLVKSNHVFFTNFILSSYSLKKK